MMMMLTDIIFGVIHVNQIGYYIHMCISKCVENKLKFVISLYIT
jgi:hypothetical protein